MKLRPMVIANSVLIAGMGAATAWAWAKVPDGKMLAVHFGIDGQPDGFAPKSEVLLIMPVLAIAQTLLFLVLPAIDPRRTNIEASAKFWNAAAISIVALLAYTHGLLIAVAMGQSVDMLAALAPALAIIFMVLGNYLSKTRSNWFGGIRTPWTLSSEYAWGRTHRAAGALYVASGALSLVVWATVGAQASLVTLFAGIMASSLLSVVLSWIFWRQDPAHSMTHGDS